MSDLDVTADERERRRLHTLIDEVAGQLRPVTVNLARELVDNNEAAVALNMISEMLVEAGASISLNTYHEFQTLARELEMSPQSSDRLQPLVRDR
jgi:hypothetical protein